MRDIVTKQVGFSELTNEWLRFKKPQVKKSSYFNYKFTIQKHFMGELGGKSLDELLDYDFNAFVEELMEMDLEVKTIRDIISNLKSILKYGEKRYKCDLNTDLISSPKLIKKDVKIFDDKEVKKMERLCFKSDDPKLVGILISLFTGLRIGEICALKWRDIDVENKVINISRTLQRVYLSMESGKKNSEVIYTTPKTQNSIRKIPIADRLHVKLEKFSKRYEKDAFVLTGEKDRYIEPLYYRKIWKDMLNEWNIDYRKYHTLRHTFATRCMRVGMDVKSLSEVLGHANVNITLNTYVHSSFETKKKYINKL